MCLRCHHKDQRTAIARNMRRKREGGKTESIDFLLRVFFALFVLSRLCLCFLMLAGALAGCAQTRPTTQPSGGYFGPTESMPQVIARINANNKRIPTLWALVASFDVWARDPRSDKTDYINGSGGYLFYRGPDEFRLRGNKDLAGLILDIGMNAEQYWLAAPSPGPDVMWYGTVGHAVDLSADLPIRPELLSEVLGVSVIDENLLDEPYPVMRFNTDRDAYMFLFCRANKDRVIVQKEVWYDRATLKAILVILFDSDGRPILRAYLANHQKISGGGDLPAVAMDYDLLFPQTRSRMVLRLERAEIQHKGVPNDASFRFPGVDVVKTAKNIDAKD